MTRTLMLTALLTLAATACGTTEAAPSGPDEPATAQAAPDPVDLAALCVRAQQRARACTDEYIPALVDTRAAADRPTGIAAAVRSDRAAVIAEAKSEWATDSTDANLVAMCTNLDASATPAQRADAPAMEACVAAATCTGYVECALPLLTKHLTH